MTANPANRFIVPEPEYPLPPRYWWLKRLVLSVVLLGIALAGVRIWWGREADRRLHSVLEAIAARGEPVRGVDLNPRDVPAAENAAEYLKQAAAAIDKTAWSPANTATNYTAAFTPNSTGWNAVAAASVAANPRVYPLARKARSFDQFDWGVRMMGQGVAPPIPHLNDVRMLANTLGDAALYAHAQGDDVAALELIRDVRHGAKGASSPRLLISSLVGIGVDALSLARLGEIAPGLRIAPEGAPPPEAGGASFPTTAPIDAQRGATPSNVRKLIAELLDERDNPGDMACGIAGDRAVNIGFVEDMSKSARLVGPMLKLDLIKMAKHFDVAIAAARQPTWPSARATLATQKLPTSQIAAILMPSLARAVEQDYRLRNERRMVAVALAVRLYHADHGDWPPTLDALVPTYLPGVPRDVLAADGSALRYLLVPGGRPDGADRPLVYSVGENNVDDTASGRVKAPNTELYGWQARAADQWRDLSRWAPPPPPATQGTSR